MIPAAIYAAVVAPVQTEAGPKSIQFGPGSEKSPFTAALSFEIINGPYAGQRLTSFLYFGEKSLPHSMKALRVCGFEGDDIDKFSDQTPEAEVSLTVEHETYEGKTRAKVKWINSPIQGYVMDKPLPPSDLRKYAAQLKGALKKLPPVPTRKAERQAPTPMPAAAKSDAFSGDDMPPWSGNDEPDPPPMDDPFA